MGPSRRHSYGILVGALAVAALTACGTTFVDESVASDRTDTSAPTSTLPPIDPDATLDALLAEVELLLLGLSQQIVDDDGAEETLDRILEVWAVADERIRRGDPTDVFDFRQGIELARTGVERNRPTDADKGYLIFSDLVDNYDAG